MYHTYFELVVVVPSAVEGNANVVARRIYVIVP